MGNQVFKINFIKIKYFLFAISLVVFHFSYSQSTADAYNISGIEKYKLKDYVGAIKDFNSSIELNPKDAVTFYNRGLAKSDLNQNVEAIEDYTIAIYLKPNYGSAYMNRGVARGILKDKINSCADLQKAGELGINDAYRAIKMFCK